MPKKNEMLLKLEGFQYAKSLYLNIGYYHILLRKMQVTYVRLLSRGENIDTRVYQWEFLTHQKFSNRKRLTYFMVLNSSVRTWMTF